MKILALIIAFGVAVAFGKVVACSGFYAGKQATASGHVLIGRTIDSPSTHVSKCFSLQEAQSNAPGRVYASMRFGAGYPLPPTTYRFFSTPRLNVKDGGRWDSICLNEEGLAFSATVTAYPSVAATNADPYVEWGFGEDSLSGYLAMTCKTALGAVEALGRVVADLGHKGGEIYMFVDPEEAWYVEVYTGHHWAAVKMPEDCVAAFGNEFMLQSFDDKSPDARCSQGLVEFAERNGFLVRGSDGLIDLSRTYAAPRVEYAHMRTWYGHHRLAPATAGEYRDDAVYPLFYRPEAKVSVADIAELMRTRYEDTEYCPDKTGRVTRVIGTVRQCSCHIIDYDPSLPTPFGATAWVTPAHAEHTPFLPVNAVLTRLTDEFSADRTTNDGRFLDYVAAHHFRRLGCIAERDRRKYGDGVRTFWKDAETKWMREFPAIVRTLDREMITRYALQTQRESLEDCKGIFNELIWHQVKYSLVPGDRGAKPIPAEPPFVPTRCGIISHQ